MVEQPSVFGAELRRLRIAAGLTVAQLASAVHYSKGQISKVETGQQRATLELARLCDAVLGAGGALAALAPPRGRRRRTLQLPTPAPTRDLRDEPNEQSGHTPWPSPTRRELMTVGAVSAFEIGAARLPQHAATDQPLLDAYRRLFGQYRRIGQVSPPRAMLPTLAEQTSALAELAAGTGTRTRTRRKRSARCSPHRPFQSPRTRTGTIPTAPRPTSNPSPRRRPRSTRTRPGSLEGKPGLATPDGAGPTAPRPSAARPRGPCAPT